MRKIVLVILFFPFFNSLVISQNINISNSYKDIYIKAERPYNCNFEYEITPYPDTTICFKDSIMLSVKPFTLAYLWTNKQGDTLGTLNAVKIGANDTTTFFVRIIAGIDTCYDSVIVNVYSHIVVDSLVQINEFCPGTCQGQVKIYVSGGYPPYEFDWSSSPFLHDNIGLGLCEKNNWVIIRDTKCSLKDTFSLKVLDRPEIDFVTDIRDGDSTAYIENPIVTFFDKSVDVRDWVWNFGDSTEISTVMNPEPHIFPNKEGTYDVWLKATSIETGCTDSVMHQIEIKKAKLIIPNVITPNGDGKNDVFQINSESNENINNKPFPIDDWYIHYKLIVFNRYGKKVYENNDYKNDWAGEHLADGVYFFILKCYGYYDNAEYKGSVTIIGNNK